MQFQRNVRHFFAVPCIIMCTALCSVVYYAVDWQCMFMRTFMCIYWDNLLKGIRKEYSCPIMTQSHNWIQKMPVFYKILNSKITTQRDCLGNTGNQRKLKIAQSYDGCSSKILSRIWRIRIFLFSIHSLFHKTVGIRHSN